MITAKSIENTTKFVEELIKEMKLSNKIEPVLYDMHATIDKEKFEFVPKFNEMTIRINSNVENREDVHIVYFIYGLDRFINTLGTEKERFTNNIDSAQFCKNFSFIVIDSASNIKAHTIDSWYKKYIEPGTGMYIGSGFDMQYIIPYEANRRDIIAKCGDSMGYVVNKNKPVYIKYLGIEEKGDEDE